mmetsp:Transcript_15021/g.60336  ORF Transcript_15021/g.60336 Transcript_15021/m.60336 type:complete len:217 (+) Transcript_15021:140-790(+)
MAVFDEVARLWTRGIQAHRRARQERESGDEPSGELDRIDVRVDAAVLAEIDHVRREEAERRRIIVVGSPHGTLDGVARSPQRGRGRRVRVGPIGQLGLAVLANHGVPVVGFVASAPQARVGDGDERVVFGGRDELREDSEPVGRLGCVEVLFLCGGAPAKKAGPHRRACVGRRWRRGSTSLRAADTHRRRHTSREALRTTGISTSRHPVLVGLVIA